MTTIADRLKAIRQDINDACAACGRSPEGVNLLAVSKTKPKSAVGEAIEAGQSHFGENYLQDALPKVTAYPLADWHFIGAIQSNKTRDIARHFNWVHSISSLKVGRRLSEQRPDHLAPIKLLIQVNLSGENSKSGVQPEDAEKLAPQLLKLNRISLEGLMAIPEATDDERLQRQRFSTLRQLRDEISRQQGISLPHLSMGMTADYPVAISEGATWIRIGTAIFGAREAGQQATAQHNQSGREPGNPPVFHRSSTGESS